MPPNSIMRSVTNNTPVWACGQQEMSHTRLIRRGPTDCGVKRCERRDSKRGQAVTDTTTHGENEQ